MRAEQVWGAAEPGFPDERTRPCPTGSIVLRVGGGRRVLRMAGEIDLCVVDRFQRSCGLDPSQAEAIDAIDAGDVTFIGAAGLRLIVQTAQASAAAGRPVMLSRSSRCLDHLLHLVGLHDAFLRPSAR